MTTIIPFEKKQVSNNFFVKNNFNNAVKSLNNLVNNESVIENSFGNSENLLKCIRSAFDYLNNKWNDSNEKFILIFAFNFDKNMENDIKKKFEKEEIFKKCINLILIGIEFEEANRTNAKNFVANYFAEKSLYIDYNDIGILNNIFKKKVLKSDELYFPIEVFKSEKSTNFDKH